MKTIISWWAKNSVAANLMMLIILIGGTVSFFTIERELMPYVTFPGAVVDVSWPGASPEDIEEQISMRIEDALADIPNLDQLRSFSREGQSTVEAQGLSNVDPDVFMQTVKLRVDQISTLPAAAERAQVRKFESSDEIMRVAVLGHVDERLLKRTAEKVRRDLSLSPHVPSVELFGTRDEEVSIEVSESELRAYGLTIAEIAAAVRASSLNVSAGTVKSGIGHIQLKTRNVADSQAEFEKIVIKQLPGGNRLYLGDVATVKDGFEEIGFLATVNGQPAILVQIQSGPNMDIVKMSKFVKDYMKTEAPNLPPGITMTLWDDGEAMYSGRIRSILENFGAGLLLVFLTLFLFLRPRIALWVSIGIATAFAGGLMLLPILGISFNMISTFAFLLVIGVIVDDAIIVGEAIHTRIEAGESGTDAVINGTQLVLKPVIFAVLTTMIFFAPSMFLTGGMSKFTMAISLVVIMALLFSLIEALLILPAHLAHLPPMHKDTRFARFQAKFANGIGWVADHIYMPTLRAALRRRYLTAAIFIGTMIISIGALSNGYVKTEFMPSSETDQIAITANLPQGTPYTRTLEVLRQIQDAEKQLEKEINDSTGGQGKLIENWYTRSRDNQVLALVKLVPPETRTLTAEQAATRLRELIGDVPDAEEIEVNYQDNWNGPPIRYVLNGADLDQLNMAADALMEKIRSFDGVYNVVNDTQSSAEEIAFDLRPGAQALGLTTADVARQVRRGFFGEEVQKLPRDGEDVRVYVRYPRADRESLEFLNDVRIRTPQGSAVPLSSVADLRYGQGTSRIVRRERQRAIVISAEALPEIANDVKKTLRNDYFDEFDAAYPSITRGQISQSNDEAQMMKEMFSFSLIAIGIAYILMAIAFASYWQPLLILLAAVPFCFTGALAGHFFLGHSLSMFSWLGISAAAGVAINDNLVLLDYLNRLRAKGASAGEALLMAGRHRFRPILLTSVTTFLGLLPLMMEQSIQAQMLVPIGVSLAFGVLFALFVTLLLVPALFAIGVDVLRVFSRKTRAEQISIDDGLAA